MNRNRTEPIETQPFAENRFSVQTPKELRILTENEIAKLEKESKPIEYVVKTPSFVSKDNLVFISKEIGKYGAEFGLTIGWIFVAFLLSVGSFILSMVFGILRGLASGLVSNSRDMDCQEDCQEGVNQNSVKNVTNNITINN